MKTIIELMLMNYEEIKKNYSDLKEFKGYKLAIEDLLALPILQDQVGIDIAQLKSRL